MLNDEQLKRLAKTVTSTAVISDSGFKPHDELGPGYYYWWWLWHTMDGQIIFGELRAIREALPWGNVMQVKFQPFRFELTRNGRELTSREDMSHELSCAFTFTPGDLKNPIGLEKAFRPINSSVTPSLSPAI